MNYKYITDCFTLCEDHLNEGGGKITSVILREFKEIPENIKDLIKQNYKLVKKIIDFYYKDFTYKASKSNTIDEAKQKIEFIKNNTNDKKKEVIEFNTLIFPWLLTTEFYNNIYENYCPNIVDPTYIEGIKEIDKFIPRENQKEAFDRLEKNGLETGIHCQATGCGKTFIILKYIDYLYKNNTKTNLKIILFTERVNILSDLFSFSKGKLEADMNKLKYWKTKGIADLTKFHIINRVTNKDKNWNEELKKSDKPTLLVINRAFLTLGKKYSIFESNDLDLILHDECHNTSSLQCHDFLKRAKSLQVKIVGFSATPLRTGKFDKTKLLEIYAKKDKPNELNLLTNYNMIYAISKNLILPPEFYWYQLESYVKNDDDNCLVTQEELGSVFEILNHTVSILPNKKIIAWCGTINMARFWKSEIEKYYKQRQNLKNFKFGLDTSADINNDYNYFSKIPKDINGNILELEDLKKDDKQTMYYGNSILFCANKHREGSDIKLLDCCIFIDKVKDRGSIPFIQSIGRALRLCEDTENKSKGVIIDGFIKDSSGYEKHFIDKIIGYYMALENINNICNEEENKYDQYIKMMDIVKFDKELKVINMKLGNRNIQIHCNKLEWEDIIVKFENILEKKMNITPEEAFNLYINKIKMLEPFKNPENNFWAEYEKLDHDELRLPKDIYEPFKNIWETKTWYDLLGFKNMYYDFITCQKVFRTNSKLIIYSDKWYKLSKNKINKLREIDNKIPPNCNEFYKFDIENNT
jgi:superfamily II DNA or RNA helicase